MRLLLDTHILLALVNNRVARLPARLAALLHDPDNERIVSVASLWEIALKHRIGKLDLEFPLDRFPLVLDLAKLPVLPVSLGMPLNWLIRCRAPATPSIACCSQCVRSRGSGW